MLLVEIHIRSNCCNKEGNVELGAHIILRRDTVPVVKMRCIKKLADGSSVIASSFLPVPQCIKPNYCVSLKARHINKLGAC